MIGGTEQEFKRTFSIREAISKDDDCIAFILRAFGSRKKSPKKIPPRATIHDFDPYAFPNWDSK